MVHAGESGGALAERLDEEKLEQLRTWGAGLSTAGNQELRATGKAILMLIDEIDALNVELWNERAGAGQAPAVAPEEQEVTAQTVLDDTLLGRLRRLDPRARER